MPLPSPKGKEKRSDFVSRCIGDKTTAKDFPDQKQRIAICYSQWEKAKKAAGAIVGSGDNEVLIEAAQKTYGGKKRSELSDSDFLFPETRSFPIVSPQDVVDAIHNFGRMGGNMTYEVFIKKLYNKAKSKGAAFVNAIPEKTKQEHNLKATDEATEDIKNESKDSETAEACEGGMVNIEVNINTEKEDDDECCDECGNKTCTCDDDCAECGNDPCTCEEDPQHESAESPEVEMVEDSLENKMGICCINEPESDASEAMRPTGNDAYQQHKVFSLPDGVN
jgi:hypothetical protein